MVLFTDPIRGDKKPIDLYRFMISGEYDQGDMALVAYDDVFDLVYDDNFRADMREKLAKPHTKTPQIDT